MVLQILEDVQQIFQSPQRITMQAVHSAYAIWAKRYPEWEAAFFDEHFLHAHVTPRFSAGQTPKTTVLVEAWVTQMGATSEQAAELTAELTPIAADFLYIVESERCFFMEKTDRKWRNVRWFVALLSGDSSPRRVKTFS